MKKIRAAILGYFRASDRLLFTLCIIASALSVTLLAGLYNTGYATSRQVWVQVGASVLGLVASIIISKIDYRTLADLWKLYLPLCYGLIAITFFFGIGRGANRAWLEVFGVSVQPAELLKVAFILTFALHLSKVQDDINKPSVLMMVALHGIAPVLVIHFLQGDDGTALMFALIMASMVFAAGLSWKYIAAVAGASVVAAPLLWFFVLDEYQQKRILITFNPELDPLVYGYQQLHGVLAIGSGQLFGKGIFAEQHIKVPEIRNDFIFAFLGESTGFMGCLGVVVLLLLICFKILFNGLRSVDSLGRYVCVGVFAMIAFQSIFNIGMCLSVLPVIGITLPFLSSGGTSVLALYAAVGLVLSVYMRSKSNMFSD